MKCLYGDELFAALSQDEILAAVTAHVEGQVTRNRLSTMTTLHPADIASMLKEMATLGLIEQVMPRRSVYRLPREVLENSTHSGDSSTHSGEHRTQIEEKESTGWRLLLQIAEPARRKHWVPRQQMRGIILTLCGVRGLRLAEIAELLERQPASVRQQYLLPLIEAGQLRYLYPGEPTHPQQAYLAVEADQNSQS